MESYSHYSVLLKESIEALITDPSGVYVDGTFGRGGHSRAILSALNEDGQLIAFDKDPEAIGIAQALAQEDKRFSIVHDSFSRLKESIDEIGNGQVNGVLLDLGVSSPQLDNADRGFSFLHDGPLDMRMNNEQGQTAAEWVNSAELDDIAFVLKEFGEERFAKRMARAIGVARENKAIETTAEFAKIISEANPAWEKGKHPATRAFQAVRIFINRELGDLKEVLDQSIDVIESGGRLVVISFHSLEDRIVKRFIRDASKGRSIPKGIPVTEDMLDKKLKTIGKAIKAGESELGENIRSRSAIMRIAERL